MRNVVIALAHVPGENLGAWSVDARRPRGMTSDGPGGLRLADNLTAGGTALEESRPETVPDVDPAAAVPLLQVEALTPAAAAACLLRRAGRRGDLAAREGCRTMP